MRKVTFILLIFLALMITSCSSEVENATLRIEMESTKRTISPQREGMEVVGYRIILTGPDGKESAPRYTYFTYLNLEGLAVGKYKVKVFGFNKDKVDMATGETEVDVIAGKNSARVRVDQLVGLGNLSLEMSWDGEAHPGVKKIVLTLTAQDGTEIPVEPSAPSGNSSSAVVPNIAAGSYTLTAKILDEKGNVLSGVAEAIRITNMDTTKGKIVFPFAPTGGSESQIVISDNTSLPIEVEIKGLETLMQENTPFTLNISIPSSSSLSITDLDTRWFLDGTEVGRGPEHTFESGVGSGIHRIDVTTETSDKGSRGSTSVVFQAAVSTNQGDPYQKYTLEDGEVWKLGGDVVMHFLPDGRLLVASNRYRILQLIRTEGAKPSLVCQYSYDDLGLSGRVADFISYGEAEDSHFPALFLVNEELGCKAVNTMVSKTQIAKTDEAADFDPKGNPDRATKFGNIVENKDFLIASIENNDLSRMGVVIFNKNSTKGSMVRRDDCYSVHPYLEWGIAGFTSASSLPDKGYSIFTAGNRSKVYRCTNNGSSSSISEYQMWTSYEEYFSYYNQGKPKSEFDAARSCGFLSKDGSYAFVFSPEAIYYFHYDGEAYSLYHRESLEGQKVADIRMCPDTMFSYLLDNDNNRLYTMTPVYDDGKKGFIFGKGNWIDYGRESADSIEISPSGELIAVFNSASTNSITLVKAAR